jgi:Membrane carboxypeptidase/penicillin-binding protein PbpC
MLPKPLPFLLRFFFFCLCFALVTSSGLRFFTPDPLPAILQWPVSPALLDDRGTLVHARLSADEEWCLPVPLEEMGRWLPLVLVAVEDRRFYSHRGVDALSIARAATMNAVQGRVVSGASTITSQLVRLSRPRARTLAAKFAEFAGAMKVEQHLGKNEILELYLNRAPFGGPIRGVEAASRLYFGKRACDLSLGEASLLVGMLKGPTAYRPDKYPQRALDRRQFIITAAARQTGFSPELTRLALNEPLPRYKSTMPALARHFSDLAFGAVFGPRYGRQPGPPASGTTVSGEQTPLFRHARKRLAATGHSPLPEGGQPFSSGVVPSSLSTRLQELLEQTLSRQLARSPLEITAAGVIVRNSTAEIVAYVGNARFDPVMVSEWVDCALAPRSPGSALKPFVYAAAMQEGLVVPSTLLADTPLRLGGMAPRNFDQTYRGPVSASYALANSLNVPAVRVQRLLGVVQTLHLLQSAGFAHLRDTGTHGDSLVLGAGEVTLLELARAYTMLANLGLDRPLTPVQNRRTVRPNPQATATAPLYGQDRRRVFSTASAFLASDILKDNTRLPFVTQLTQAREQSPLAFKTGTSFGLRDAWTCAWFPGHTVALWFGRADGGSDPSLVGLRLAAPAALHIARVLALETAPDLRWYTPPPIFGPERPHGPGETGGVSAMRLCALSGAAPSPLCPVTTEQWVIPSVFRTTPCTLHALRDNRITVIWPPELEDFEKRRRAGKDYSRPPLISSPIPGTEYILTPGAREDPLPLKAEGVAYPVHWFAGTRYLGVQTSPDAPLFWQPKQGTHTLSLLDAEEKTARADVRVIDATALRDDLL